MPLILFSGYPSSGKTTYAKQLCKLLQDKIDSSDEKFKNYKIIYHSDESLGIEHNDYITSQDERKLRSKITSAVRRDLSKTNIVIVDSLNYIKGFRYQLHCEVKNLSTSFALIHVMCPLDTVKSWNKTWDDDLLAELVARYEEPNPNNRWDSPLFPLLAPSDNIEDIIDELYDVVFNIQNKSTSLSSSNNSSSSSLNLQSNRIKSNIQKPNSVTILKPAKQSNFMQLLEMETSKVNKKLMDTIKEDSMDGSYQGSRIIIQGDDVNDPDCHYIDMPLQPINLPKLQRLKRQFIQLNKLRDLEIDRIVPLYCDYLNKNLSS